MVEDRTIEILVLIPIPRYLSTRLSQLLHHSDVKGFQRLYVAGIEQIKAISQPDHGTDGARFFKPLVFRRPPSSLLRGVLPEVNAPS
jgi:hypothetical protein